MYKCVICRFEVELDDVEIGGANGCCVCLACYARMVESEKRMPKDLRRAITCCVAEAA